MAHVKTILKQSTFMVVFWFLSTLLGFFSNIVYTHFLSPKTFGDFTLARTIVNLLPLFCLFGLHKGLLRQGSIALGKNDEVIYREVRNFTISYATIISWTCGVVVFLTAPLIAKYGFKNIELTNLIRYFSFAIPVLVISNMMMSLFQVNKMADRGQFLYQVIYYSLLLVIFLACIPFFKEENLIIVSFVSAHVIYLLILFYYQKKFNYRFSFSIRKSEKKTIFNISFPQFLSALFNQSQKWGDTFFLGIFNTTTNVGIYYIGLRIAAFVSIPANAINQIFMPIAGRLIGQENHRELNDLYKLITRLIFVCGSLAFGVIFFLRNDLLSLFGKNYQASASVIFIILISETIDFGVGPARQLITMSGGGKINLINSVLTLTINIVSSYILIPRYGLIGAAFANAATNGSLQIITVIELIVIYKLSPFNIKYFVTIILFLACIFGANFLPVHIYFKLAVFVLVLSGLYAFVIINKQEKQQIKEMVRKRSKKKKGVITENLTDNTME